MLCHKGRNGANTSQNKLEAQYTAKRQGHESEVQDLKQQLELKANEIRSLGTTIDSLKSVNEELKVCYFSIQRSVLRVWRIKC